MISAGVKTTTTNSVDILDFYPQHSAVSAKNYYYDGKYIIHRRGKNGIAKKGQFGVPFITAN